MSSSSKDSTAWDVSSRSSRSRRQRQAADDVPDDWDADLDEGEVDSKRLWEEANAKEPMPEILVTTSSTTSAVPPPTSAFAPTLKILKRPQSQSPKPTGTAAPRRTIAEREAEYKAARERIFSTGKAEASSDTSVSSDKPPPKPRPDRTDVLRQPLGPSPSGRGFSSRRSHSGMSSPASGASSPARTPIVEDDSTQPLPESSHADTPQTADND